MYMECPPLPASAFRPIIAENIIGNSDRFQVGRGWGGGEWLAEGAVGAEVPRRWLLQLPGVDSRLFQPQSSDLPCCAPAPAPPPPLLGCSKS